MQLQPKATAEEADASLDLFALAQSDCLPVAVRAAWPERLTDCIASLLQGLQQRTLPAETARGNWALSGLNLSQGTPHAEQC